MSSITAKTPQRYKLLFKLAALLGYHVTIRTYPAHEIIFTKRGVTYD